LFLGAALGGTSAAVVIPTINQLNLIQGPKRCFTSNQHLVIFSACCSSGSVGRYTNRGIECERYSQQYVDFDSLCHYYRCCIGHNLDRDLKKYLSGMKNTMFTQLPGFYTLWFLRTHRSERGLSILAFGITAVT
jgi:hypothetical protein